MVTHALIVPPPSWLEICWKNTNWCTFQMQRWWVSFLFIRSIYIFFSILYFVVGKLVKKIFLEQPPIHPGNLRSHVNNLKLFLFSHSQPTVWQFHLIKFLIWISKAFFLLFFVLLEHCWLVNIHEKVEFPQNVIANFAEIFQLNSFLLMEKQILCWTSSIWKQETS